MTYHLREMTLDDIEFFVETRNECSKWLHNESKYTVEQSKEWFQTTKPKFFIIEHNSERIGYFRTSWWNLDHKFVSIGADINVAFRGQGHAVEVYKLFISQLYMDYGINTFFLEVLSHNHVAMKLYEKLGFLPYGARHHDTRNGIEVDSISMFYRKET